MARKKKEEVEKVVEVEEEVAQEVPIVEKTTTLGLLQRLGYAPGDTVDLATLNKLARR